MASHPKEDYPLHHHPPTPPTQTLILSHPSARLSSSPASSPRVIESTPARRRSIQPEMSHLTDHSTSTVADFFEDSSSNDASEWEDDNGTRNFSDGVNMPNQGSATSTVDFRQVERGRQRREMEPPSLSERIPARDNGTAGAKSGIGKGIDRASQVSLRRPGKGKVVHNRGSGSACGGTPRGSLRSNDSDHAAPIIDVSASLLELQSRDSDLDTSPRVITREGVDATQQKAFARIPS
jgi:hypothetical protein